MVGAEQLEPRLREHLKGDIEGRRLVDGEHGVDQPMVARRVRWKCDGVAQNEVESPRQVV